MFSRRQIMAGALVAPFFPAGLTSAHDAVSDTAACCARLARLFPESLDAARGLGVLCRTCDQPSVSRTDLLDALCPDPSTCALVAHGPDDVIRRWADAKIRTDFAEGRVVRVNGWVFSETEIRLFSLLARA